MTEGLAGMHAASKAVDDKLEYILTKNFEFN